MPLSAASLIERINGVFSELPDARGQSNNRHYVIQDAALSAFSVFFSQSPSFLDSQVRMQKQQGRNNASSLFGVHEIPCDNQIRNLLDPVPPETLFPLMTTIGDTLYGQGYLEAFRSINGTFLIALDGTDFFSSEKISCPCCSKSKRKNGQTLYRHIADRGREGHLSSPPSEPCVRFSGIKCGAPHLMRYVVLSNMWRRHSLSRFHLGFRRVKTT